MHVYMPNGSVTKEVQYLDRLGLNSKLTIASLPHMIHGIIAGSV